MSQRTTTSLGLLFIACGVALLAAHFFVHQEMHALPTSLALASVLLGALMIEPASTGSALKTLGQAVVALVPWKAKASKESE